MYVAMKGIKMSTVNMKMKNVHVSVGSGSSSQAPILLRHSKKSVYTLTYTSYQASVIAFLRSYRLHFYPKDVVNINNFEPRNNNGIDIPAVGNSGELAASIFLIE